MRYIGTEPIKLAGGEITPRLLEPGDSVDDLPADYVAGLAGRDDFEDDDPAPPSTKDTVEVWRAYAKQRWGDGYDECTKRELIERAENDGNS